MLAEHGHPLHRSSRPTRPAACAGSAPRIWQDVGGGRIDPTTAYRVNLPSAGGTSTVFFYDGPISRAVAFEHLLMRGEYLADRLTRRFQRRAPLAAARPHRHRRRDLRPPPPQRRHGAGLRAAPHRSQQPRAAHQLRRVPGKPPAHARGGDLREQRLELRARRRALAQRLRLQLAARHPGWNQAGARRCAPRSTGSATRSPRSTTSTRRKYLRDPWEARDDYIAVILDRSPESIDRFFAEHARRELTPDERDHRAQAARDAAPRHAHVHELRLVLRRALRHRNRAGDPVRRARRPARPGSVRTPASSRASSNCSSRRAATSRSTRTAAASTRSSSGPPCSTCTRWARTTPSAPCSRTTASAAASSATTSSARTTGRSPPARRASCSAKPR